MVIEATNPGDQNPRHDQNQQARTDRVHDSLKVTLVLRARDQRSGAANERHLRGVSDDGVRLAALAASGVVDGIGAILVDGEGFSCHRGLIDGEECIARAVLLDNFIIITGFPIFFTR